MRRVRIDGLLAAALLAVAPAGPGAPAAAPIPGAQAWRILLDPEATQVGFSLGALWHTVHGRGGPVAAELWWDPGSGRMAGRVSLPAASLETGSRRRDRRMHGEVLASDDWPDIVLRPLRAAGDLDPAAGGVLQIEAELELRGARHPLSFPVEILVTDQETGAFTADLAFSVPYVAWGLPDPSGLILRVDKEVRVTVKTRGRLRPPPGTSTADR